MGYYTTYSLSYKFLAHQDRFESTLRDEMQHENWEPVDKIMDCGQYTTKWYDYERTLKALSKKYPMVVFTLAGFGEESGDVWVKHFCAGKTQDAKAKIVFDDFDPDKLE